jgi:ABC-2 type transport system permease protein
MNKIGLIIEREYLQRVRKKSFLIMTFLGPVLFAAVMVVPAWLASRDSSESRVQVLDRSGLFEGKFKSEKGVVFEYAKGEEGGLKKSLLDRSEQDLLLVIDPPVSAGALPDVRIFAQNNPPLEVLSEVEHQMNDELRNRQLRQSGIDPGLVEKIKPEVDVKSTVLSDEGEKEGGSLAATIVGYASGLLIYMFIFLYGSQIMMSVMEEKTGRVVELLVSSVKPFQLMLGKILGVALVGLTQFVLWIVLSFAISSAAGKLFLDDLKTPAKARVEMVGGGEELATKAEGKGMSLLRELGNVNAAQTLICFIIYFLGGYLFYSALFAAVGSAVESQQEAQQFMLPITIPIILAIVMAQFVIKEPNSSLSFWLSVIPFTSPIIMMIRIPFEPPFWQLAVSIVALIGGFLGAVWISGRIFRVGILMYGKKITWAELIKWVGHK